MVCTYFGVYHTRFSSLQGLPIAILFTTLHSSRKSNFGFMPLKRDDMQTKELLAMQPDKYGHMLKQKVTDTHSDRYT